MVFGEQNSLTLSTKKCFQKCFNHQKTRHHFASFRSVDKTARIICSFSCYVVYLDINILINQPRSVNLWSEKQVGLQCTYTPAHCILVFFIVNVQQQTLFSGKGYVCIFWFLQDLCATVGQVVIQNVIQNVPLHSGRLTQDNLVLPALLLMQCRCQSCRLHLCATVLYGL